MVVKLRRLEASVTRDFKTELEAAWKPGTTSVVVDLMEVEFIDSSGVGTLLGIYKRLQGEHPSVRLLRVQPAVQTVIELLRLHRVFEVQT